MAVCRWVSGYVFLEKMAIYQPLSNEKWGYRPFTHLFTQL